MGLRDDLKTTAGTAASGAVSGAKFAASEAVGLARKLPGASHLPLIGGGDDQLTTAEVDGYFPADSMIRRLHGERMIAFSGVRALLMQACDPVAVVGFQRHSIIFSDPQTRLQSTDERMSRMYFGTVEQAEQTGSEIRQMHSRVKGKTGADYGPVPAGTPYAGDDPVLGLWVLATLADSALLYYEQLIGSLTADERQSYWDDYKKIGSLLGMPDGSMPETEPELREYVSTRCRDGSLYISGEIRDQSVGIIFDPPFEGWVRVALTPVGEVVKLTSIGLLPDEIRRMYGFSWDPAREALLRTTIFNLKTAIKLWPDTLRIHPAAREEAGALFGTEEGEDWRMRTGLASNEMHQAEAEETVEDELGVPAEGKPAPDETKGTASGDGNGAGALSRLEQALASDEPEEKEGKD